MLKKVLLGISVLLVIVFVIVATYVLRPTSEASAPIEAVPVEVEGSEPQTALKAEPVDSQESEGMIEDAKPENPESGNLVVYSIVPEASDTRFSLDELLRGVPTTVIGKTSQVAGEIAVDLDNPANVQIGTILVNARTLVTDNDFRNRAINNEILDTRDYEFITFTTTSITGLPDNPQFGEELVFQIKGDLTIRDITQEVTFVASVTVESEEQLRGSASTVVALEDYDINIPDVPSVADVDEEVFLEIDLVATAK